MSQVLVHRSRSTRHGRPDSPAPRARRWCFALAALLTLLLLLSFAGAGVARAATYDIVPFTGLNGTVSPAIAQTVTAGSSATFAITAATDYHVADVRVDGASVGAVTSYTFTNVTAGHTLVATFAPDVIAPWQLQQPLPTGDFLGGVTFTDAAHGWAAGGGFGAVKGSQTATSDPAPRGNGFALGNPDLLVTADGGATWQTRSGLPAGGQSRPRQPGRFSWCEHRSE